MIDNCCSACITTSRSDFVGPTTKISRRVSGVAGVMMVTEKGTVRWSIKDNEGRKHTFNIPNSYLAPSAPSRLLSPQHWAQSAKDNQERKRRARGQQPTSIESIYPGKETLTIAPFDSIRQPTLPYCAQRAGLDDFEDPHRSAAGYQQAFPMLLCTANIVATDEESSCQLLKAQRQFQLGRECSPRTKQPTGKVE